MHVLADVLHWAVVSSLRASVLAILVLAITAVGRRWLRPGLAYVLWALVLLLLALPRIPASPLSIYNLLPPAASAGVLAPVERSLIGGSLLTSPSESAGADPGTPSQAGAAKASDASSTGVPSRAAKGASGAPSLPAWQLALVSLWLAGIVFLLGKVAVAERRLRQRLGRARPVTDARVLEVWNDCLETAGRTMRPALAEVEGIPSPVLIGVIRPRVLLPAGLATRLTDQELLHIFVHELVHHHRRDIWVNWFSALLTIVHWFNPLVWWGARGMAEAQELACDAAAMGRLRTEEPTAYGHTLVRVLELTRFEDPQVPSVAGIMRSGSLTRRRIQMIHLFKGPARWSIAGGGAVVMALAIVAMTRSGLPVAQPHVSTPPAKGTVSSHTRAAGQSTSSSTAAKSSSQPPTTSYAGNALIAALAKEVGTTLYVPESIPGSPAVTSASPFATPPTPGVNPQAKHYMIHFGSVLSEFIIAGVTPSALPKGGPLEESFVVAGAGNANAVVYRSVVSKVPPGVTYTVALNVGNLSEWISSSTLTEAQMMTLGKTLVAVAPGVSSKPSSTTSTRQSGSQSQAVSSTTSTATSDGASPVVVQGTWKVVTGQSDPFARMFPAQFLLGVRGANTSTAQNTSAFPSGEPLTIEIVLISTGSVDQPNMALHLNPWAPVVQIVPDSAKGFGAPIWQGKITGGPTDVPADGTATGTFSWSETNSAGKQVPAGMYAVRFSGAYGGGVLLSGTAGGKAFSGAAGAYPEYETFVIR